MFIRSSSGELGPIIQYGASRLYTILRTSPEERTTKYTIFMVTNMTNEPPSDRDYITAQLIPIYISLGQ